MRSARDRHLLNYLSTISVPIAKIDLSLNKKGDRFKTKDGEIVTFCGKWYEFEEMKGEFYIFHLGDGENEYAEYCSNGQYYSHKSSTRDLEYQVTKDVELACELGLEIIERFKYYEYSKVPLDKLNEIMSYLNVDNRDSDLDCWSKI